MKLKTISLSLVIVLFSVFLVELIKNIYLHFFYYKHGITSAIKNEGLPGNVFGSWEYTFDTIQCGMDERHIFRFALNSDSTGAFSYDHYANIYNSDYCHPYSWESLFGSLVRTESFSKRGSLIFSKTKLQLNSTRDTTDLFYKYSGDSLYISFGMNENGKPVWGNIYSIKAELIHLIPAL